MVSGSTSKVSAPVDIPRSYSPSDSLSSVGSGEEQGTTSTRDETYKSTSEKHVADASSSISATNPTRANLRPRKQVLNAGGEMESPPKRRRVKEKGPEKGKESASAKGKARALNPADEGAMSDLSSLRADPQLPRSLSSNNFSATRKSQHHLDKPTPLTPNDLTKNDPAQTRLYIQMCADIDDAVTQPEDLCLTTMYSSISMALTSPSRAQAQIASQEAILALIEARQNQYPDDARSLARRLAKDFSRPLQAYDLSRNMTMYHPPAIPSGNLPPTIEKEMQLLVKTPLGRAIDLLHNACLDEANLAIFNCLFMAFFIMTTRKTKLESSEYALGFPTALRPNYAETIETIAPPYDYTCVVEALELFFGAEIREIVREELGRWGKKTIVGVKDCEALVSRLTLLIGDKFSKDILSQCGRIGGSAERLVLWDEEHEADKSKDTYVRIRDLVRCLLPRSLEGFDPAHTNACKKITSFQPYRAEPPQQDEDDHETQLFEVTATGKDDGAMVCKSMAMATLEDFASRRPNMLGIALDFTERLVPKTIHCRALSTIDGVLRRGVELGPLAYAVVTTCPLECTFTLSANESCLSPVPSFLSYLEHHSPKNFPVTIVKITPLAPEITPDCSCEPCVLKPHTRDLVCAQWETDAKDMHPFNSHLVEWMLLVDQYVSHILIDSDRNEAPPHPPHLACYLHDVRIIVEAAQYCDDHSGFAEVLEGDFANVEHGTSIIRSHEWIPPPGWEKLPETAQKVARCMLQVLLKMIRPSYAIVSTMFMESDNATYIASVFYHSFMANLWSRHSFYASSDLTVSTPPWNIRHLTHSLGYSPTNNNNNNVNRDDRHEEAPDFVIGVAIACGMHDALKDVLKIKLPGDDDQWLFCGGTVNYLKIDDTLLPTIKFSTDDLDQISTESEPVFLRACLINVGTDGQLDPNTDLVGHSHLGECNDPASKCAFQPPNSMDLDLNESNSANSRKRSRELDSDDDDDDKNSDSGGRPKPAKKAKKGVSYKMPKLVSSGSESIPGLRWPKLTGDQKQADEALWTSRFNGWLSLPDRSLSLEENHRNNLIRGNIPQIWTGDMIDLRYGRADHTAEALCVPIDLSGWESRQASGGLGVLARAIGDLDRAQKWATLIQITRVYIFDIMSWYLYQRRLGNVFPDFRSLETLHRQSHSLHREGRSKKDSVPVPQHLSRMPFDDFVEYQALDALQIVEQVPRPEEPGKPDPPIQAEIDAWRLELSKAEGRGIDLRPSTLNSTREAQRKVNENTTRRRNAHCRKTYPLLWNLKSQVDAHLRGYARAIELGERYGPQFVNLCSSGFMQSLGKLGGTAFGYMLDAVDQWIYSPPDRPYKEVEDLYLWPVDERLRWADVGRLSSEIKPRPPHPNPPIGLIEGVRAEEPTIEESESDGVSESEDGEPANERLAGRLEGMVVEEVANQREVATVDTRRMIEDVPAQGSSMES